MKMITAKEAREQSSANKSKIDNRDITQGLSIIMSNIRRAIDAGERSCDVDIKTNVVHKIKEILQESPYKYTVDTFYKYKYDPSSQWTEKSKVRRYLDCITMKISW